MGEGATLVDGFEFITRHRRSGGRRWRFHQPAGQVPMPMHRTTHHNVRALDLVEQDMLLKWAEDHHEPPFLQARILEAAHRANQGMPFKQTTRGFDRVEVTVSDVPARVERVPLELMFQVRDEVVGLDRAHGVEDLARARSRTASKSALVSGVTGLSADSNNHASNSGVGLNGTRCCSRSERMRSLTSSLASAQTPVRTCSSRKRSTSLASAIVMAAK